MEGALRVSAADYAQCKVTEDNLGTDFVLPGEEEIGRHRAYRFGPEVTVPLATSERLIALLNIRYLWETGARTKTEEKALALTATFPLPNIPIT